MSDDMLAQAVAALEEGDPQGAARCLRFASQDGELARDEARLRTLLEVVRGIGEAMEIEELRTTAEAARELEPQALYDVGFALVEVGLPEVAVPPLQCLDRLLPGQQAVVSELASALERATRHAEARDVLLGNPDLHEDFWIRYLIVFNALAAGDLGTARARIGALAPDGEDQGGAAERVRAMVRRAERLAGHEPLGLREWQYLLNGFVLLHLSPYGFEEGMAGRYAWGQDSVGAIRRDLLALVAALRETDALPVAVLEVPERGSRIVAQALARLLDVPVRPFAPGAEGLLAVYDLGSLSELPEDTLGALLGRGGEGLFARALCWTEEPPLIPSWVGLLAQSWTAPWAGGLRMGADGPFEAPPSDEPDAVWVERILAADSDDDEVAPGDDPAARAAFMASARPEPGDMLLEGPVRSSRFG